MLFAKLEIQRITQTTFHSGDIDVLVTHREYSKPLKGILDKIIDELSAHGLCCIVVLFVVFVF
jgi:hypothetical protein